MASSEGHQGFRASFGSFVRQMVRLPGTIIEGISRVMSHATPRQDPPANPQPQPQATPVRQEREGAVIIPEDWLFLTLFERQFGERHPFFYACSFSEALKIAKDESKLVFLYLHSPESAAAAPFCRDTLCSQRVTEFLDANFVSWGAVASRGEGLEMASSLQANTFPFGAVVAATSDKAIAVLRKVEGPLSPEEIVEILQRVMDEQGPAFRGLREAEEEARRANRQLRQEQDAAFREALEKDKGKERAKELLEANMQAATERRMKEHKERLRKHPTRKQPISKQKETTEQPITKILIRFPDGSRKEQSFQITDTIRSIYKFIDSQDLPGLGSYQLIFFPKRVYGYEQLDMTMKDADLHPNAALFLEQL